MNTRLEYLDFVLLGIESFDDLNPVQRFCQPTCDIGVDLAPFAKDGTNVAEGLHRYDPKQRQWNDQKNGHPDIDGDQQREGYHSGQHSSNQLYQTGSYQVPHPFDIGHDAGDEGTGLGTREVADG